MIVNPQEFFETIRDTLFRGELTKPQVDGINSILQTWASVSANSDPRFVAYSLGTIFHETGCAMQPVTEILKGIGKPYGVKVPPFDQAYYGRGLIQLTWAWNYTKADVALHRMGFFKGDENLTQTPDLALRPDVAGAIAVAGMTEGWFTGRKLADFFIGTRSDWVDARTIINGHDRAALVAAYALHFYDAIIAGS